VRASAVRRIVAKPGPLRPYQPNLLAWPDGRVVIARSLRPALDSVQILTKSGVVTARLSELQEVHLSPATPLADLLREAGWASDPAEEQTWRIALSGGARLTVARSLSQRFTDERRKDWLAVRPFWAWDTIHVTPSRIAAITYSEACEVPLSALPVRELPRTGGIQNWPWQANRSVKGDPLQVGAVLSAHGFGVHAPCTLEVTVPPGSRTLHGWVGLDPTVGNGGCVQCQVFKDELSGDPLWGSGFLQGSDGARPLGPLNLPDLQRLLLQVEQAHEGRPTGADPLDVRDHVNWVEGWVRVDPAAIPKPINDIPYWIPVLKNWEPSPGVRERMTIEPRWKSKERSWVWALILQPLKDDPGEYERAEWTFERTLPLTLSQARVTLSADQEDGSPYSLIVALRVNENDAKTSRDDLHFTTERRTGWETREWGLGGWVGKNVTLKISVKSSRHVNNQNAALILAQAALQPLILDLPETGEPLRPEIPLTKLIPLKVSRAGRALTLQPGKLPSGEPLVLRGYPLTDGYGVPSNTDITYQVDPSWRKFVAVLGLVEGWQGIGPYEILLDGELHWRCEEPREFDRNAPGIQVAVPLPPGHETITLRVRGVASHAAWGHAGFDTKN